MAVAIASLALAGPAGAGSAAAQAPPKFGQACAWIAAHTSGLGRCSEVESPWIAVRGLHAESWKLRCPAATPYNLLDARLRTTAGQDEVPFALQRTSAWLTVAVAPQAGADSIGPSPPGTADYYAFNLDPARAWAWRYSYPCGDSIPADRAGAARASAAARPVTTSGASGVRAITAERALPRRGDVLVRRFCPSGTRLTQARHGVGYFTSSAPRTVLHRVHVGQGSRSATYRVTTSGAPAGTRLQTTIECRPA